MNEQPSLAAKRRDNLAKARAVKAERRANGTYSMSGVHAKLDTQQQAIDALLLATTKLSEAAVMMAQLLAHPPTRTRDVAETLARMGQAQPDGRGSEMARFCEEATAQPPIGFQVPLERNFGPVSGDHTHRLEEGAVLVGLNGGEFEVPRGTATEAESPYDPVAMALELAEMAAEDDEPPPPPDEAEVWSKRLGTYYGTHLWLPAWGPRPGQPGCLAPPDMLNGGGR